MEQPFFKIPSLEVKAYKSGTHEINALEGTISLSAWKGFQSRRGPYNGIDKNEPGDGTIKMTVGEFANSAESLSITDEQVNAYRFMVDEQNNIKENILNTLLIEYKRLQKEYGVGEEDENMPDVSTTEEFKNIMGLSIVHLMDISKDGLAYIGYEFGCNWDPEHGLGVMTHKDRVIEIGAADTSFEAWIAEKDIDPVKAEKELDAFRNAPQITVKKPWWKFW